MLRRTDLYSTELDKVAVPEEHLLVMGVAVRRLLPRSITATVGTPVFPFVELPQSTIKSLSGNVMHLAAVGTCLLFALGQEIECMQ